MKMQGEHPSWDDYRLKWSPSTTTEFRATLTRYLRLAIEYFYKETALIFSRYVLKAVCFYIKFCNVYIM